VSLETPPAGGGFKVGRLTLWKTIDRMSGSFLKRRGCNSVTNALTGGQLGAIGELDGIRAPNTAQVRQKHRETAARTSNWKHAHASFVVDQQKK